MKASRSKSSHSRPVEAARPDAPKRATGAAPRVGFVSLGCPKALVDSEQIVTQLRAEGYEIAPTYEGADLVVVNTCGFIDAAVAESLDAIGEALAANGKVIVTGCLGAKDGGGFVRAAHPQVLAVTGPHATAEVMSAVHAQLPKPHDPFVDLVPPQGIKLTPTHYAYLKISEGCNHRCTFCIIPSMRGDLVSRPIGEVLAEAERLLRAGVRELLVVSQDTSAYGVDVRYRTGFWQGRPLKTRMTELATALDALARAHGAWVRLHYVYPYPHVDEVIGRMTADPGAGRAPSLSRRAVPAREPAHPQADEAPGQCRGHAAARSRRGARRGPISSSAARSSSDSPARPSANSRSCSRSSTAAQLDRVGCFAYSPVDGAAANALPDPVPDAVKEERRARFMAAQATISAARLARRVGETMTVLVDAHEGKTAIARSAADAPEIDGVVRIANGGKLAVGAFARVKVTGADEHDLRARIER